jgi:hypothetical protein
MSTASFGSAHGLDIKILAKRVIITPEFLEYVRAAVSPGTTLIITTYVLATRRAADLDSIS